MIQKITNFYLNKGLLLFAGIGAIVLWLIDGIMLVVMGMESYFAWLYLAIISLLFFAFLKGQTNIQKMLFGALLMYLIADSITMVKLYINSPMTIILGTSIALLCTSIGQFIAHIFQQIDHTGKTPAVLINQFFGLGAIATIISIIAELDKFSFTISSLEYFVYYFAYLFTCIMIICMETRVEAYKQIRTVYRCDGTWDDDKRQKMKTYYFKLISKKNN